MNSKITIFILDDHQMLIDGLSALLKNEKEFHIVGTSNFPEKALDEIIKLKPNILLTDVNMLIMSGIEGHKAHSIFWMVMGVMFGREINKGK